MPMTGKSQASEPKDSWFNPDEDAWRQAPANLVILRATHFPESYSEIRHDHEDDSLTRTVGRDVTLRQAMAEAYDCSPAQVILPSGAPQGRFDFLVTTSSRVRAHLRNALRNELHYSAHRETQNTDVFLLIVSDPALPGLAASSSDEQSGIRYNDGKLYFQHEPLSAIVEGLSEGLNKPVEDKTGSTNAYDFSVDWNSKVERSMENGDWSLAGVKEVLVGWGLTLESTNIPMDMYIVTGTKMP